MYYNANTIIYHNGQFVKAADATIDLYSQSMHYGLSVFEGIRSYASKQGKTKIFKAKEHYLRLQTSALALNMPFTWDIEALETATYQVLEQNQLQNAYIRPMVYAPANMSFSKNSQSYIAIQAWQMAPFLGNQLLNVVTSSFQRPNPKAFHIQAKAGGHYVNSILASQEAKAKGFDEAILTDIHGYIAEASSANIFFEQNGILYTPQLGNILPGITRATVLQLCQQLNIQVVEGNFTPEQMQAADGAFLCGTAAEIVGMASFNTIPFKKTFPETLGSIIQTQYANLVTND